ncbi:MAG: hypothetical protein CVV49_07255 [Spirochaetae bacterium HGW-Spirochaetae-5]|nr:MAG: hypothetical protein CVV49_07255 [Spirochaetae bacterium HGW-Spirochaetae-5]
MKKFLIFSACALSVLISCDTNYDTLTIVYSSPVNNSTGVLPDFFVEIEFSSDVNRTDIEDNFSIKGSGDVPGNFQWINGKRFRYIPVNPVTKTGRYLMEITRNVRDTDGNTMDTDFLSDFYIGTDFTPPAVLSSDPPFTTGAAYNIAVNQNLTINFSKSMNRESVEKGFSLSPDVTGYFVWSESSPGLANSRITYTLLVQMAYGKLYSMSVGGSAMDISGNSLGRDYRVNFITGSDFTPPTVAGIYDSAAAVYWFNDAVNTGISKSVEIAADFSEPMDRVSVEKAFSITPSAAGNFSWVSDEKLLFKPSAPLSPETVYQIYIDKSAKDINGLSLSSPYSVEIKTSADNSLYVKCGMIWGSGDNITYNLLSEGVPLPANWPLIITMGTGTPVPQYYYIRLQFVSLLAPYTPVNVSKYSVIDNILIETFKSGPAAINVDKAKIVSIAWTGSSTVTIQLSPMTNKLIAVNPPANTIFHTPALYRLTLAGGANGIKDINGNTALNDIVIEFREAL